MSAEVYSTIKVRPDVHKKLKDFAKSKRDDIQELASDILLMHLERSLVLKEIGPTFDYKIVDNEIRITDSKARRMFTVFRRDHQLYCDDDKATNCIHVQFASLTPELVRLWTRQS